MKARTKSIVMAMALCFIMALTACGKNETISNESTENTPNDVVQTQETGGQSGRPEENSGKTDNQDTGNDVLVAYFSATGTTKGVAEKIAAITNADMYEIIPADPYTDEDLDYNDDTSRTSIEMNDPDARPEIGSEAISLEEYTVVYIGYPIWWGEVPRIMSTFVESYHFDGITVIPFCTSSGSDIGESGNDLAEQAGSGNWLAGQRFSGSVSDEELQSWVDGLQ